VENLGPVINTKHRELDPAIAPDESYLIYTPDNLTEYGGHDLYITFQKIDGSWTKPINMGGAVNSPDHENRVNITADGKYILFMRGPDDYTDIYWVDAKIVEKLKPKYLKKGETK
jgi:Tol biopolymer transport system component